ncbi:MAG: FAD-dependent monooxygenase, partial [Geodermatophilaceae bacterium]|nr:FAD-dependent monooxygenase [Geodermatophilaceae bacterium]
MQIGVGPPEEHDYVVGADGVKSAVRPAVSAVHGLRPSAMTAASWRFVVPNPGVDFWTT